MQSSQKGWLWYCIESRYQCPPHRRLSSAGGGREGTGEDVHAGSRNSNLAESSLQTRTAATYDKSSPEGGTRGPSLRLRDLKIG
jgi:hypothetical protein